MSANGAVSEEAVDMAQKYQEAKIVEYGISFTKKKGRKITKMKPQTF